MTMSHPMQSAPTAPSSGGERRFCTDIGAVGMWALLAAGCAVVLPPFLYLIKTSLTVPLPGARTAIGLDNYARVAEIGGSALWGVTITFAAGASLLAVLLGASTAWLVARTNVPFRQAVFVGAFLSLAAPPIVKGIGWILLLGPNNGLINNLLREWFEIEGTPVELFSLGGMISIEGLLFTPIAFLLCLPSLSAMDPSLEEAAAMAGARWWRTLAKVTFPLARPSLLAVLLLSFIRALESFEVPLLIGVPGRVETATTALYHTVHSGFMPRYGEASAYAVLLVIAVTLPLAWYYRTTREAARFATVTGKGFRPARIDLGLWKYPCALWVLIIPLALAAPLLIMLWASLLPLYSGPSPDDFARMTLANYWAVWAREDTVAGIYNSLLVGAGSACAVAAAGLLMGWVVVRRHELTRWAIDIVASLPLVFPGIVLGIAVMVEFLDLRFIPIYGTVWILIFAFVVKFLPYGMRFCHAGVLSINRDLEDSAYMSGAGHMTVLRRIVLPLASPAVVAIWIYVFMNAIRDLSIAILLSGPNNGIISIVILDLWNNGEVPQLAALSVVVAAGAAVLGLVFMKVSATHRLYA
jgi:iron(III) transport system permease protein